MCLSLLTSCTTTIIEQNRYDFPVLEYETQSVDENGNVIERNKYDSIVFYYDAEKDTVTITYDYYMEMIKYGIKTGGFSAKK